MLAASNHFVVLQASDRGEPQGGHLRGRGTERTVADDGVLRVRVEVQDGGQIHIDPNRPQLGGGRRRGCIGQLSGVTLPEHRARRKNRKAGGKSRDAATFLVY